MQITGRRKVSKGSKQTWRRDSILECLHTLLVVFFRFFFSQRGFGPKSWYHTILCMAEEADKKRKRKNLSGLSLLENKIAMAEWTKNLLAIFVQIEVYVGVFIYLLCQGGEDSAWMPVYSVCWAHHWVCFFSSKLMTKTESFLFISICSHLGMYFGMDLQVFWSTLKFCIGMF